MGNDKRLHGMRHCPRCGREEDGVTVLAYSYLSNFLEEFGEKYSARAACTNCGFSIDVGDFTSRRDAVERVVRMWNSECGEGA